MSSSPVAELEAGLNAMLNLKPPGVSGSQIKSITTLCVDNAQSESVLIQKIFTHFKKTPGSHKLGVLYVVDSVTRRWIDHAKQQGQDINSSAPDGTYAAGVHRVTELLPVLMNDILQSAPGEQKEKIKKLVDIWEKGQTFPSPMIETFKQKLNAPTNESTTPINSPPPGPGLPGLQGINVAPISNPSTGKAPDDIMEALKNMVRQNVTAAPSYNGLQTQAPAPVPDNYYNVSMPQNGAAQQQHLPVTQSQPAYSFPAAPPPLPVNASTMPYAYPPPQPVQGQAPAFPATASSQPSGYPGVVPIPPPASGIDPAVANQLQLIKLLVDQGVPEHTIPALLATMQNGFPSIAPAAVPPPPQPGQVPYSNSWGQVVPRPDESRDQHDYDARAQDRYNKRSRSRSPSRHWDSRDSSHGRNERRYDSQGRDSPGRGHDRAWGSKYRERSPTPPSYDRSSTNQKWFTFDETIPKGHIKVLSRTLFVGGVTCPESELRSIFGKSGRVQTCIVNKDKRHAFVKMLTRRDAVIAKQAMENSTFRTRWGVGFGPRDCSDYQTGESVIPISKLTEADRKWMLTAEYGGSGGQPIESGLVVEEPDIEIGAGVSSKAISRRMQTDRGGKHGPKSSRSNEEEEQNLSRWRRNKDNRRDDRRDDRNSANSQQPDVTEFPYGISAGPNGMPVFPPGFVFPAPNQ